MVCRMLTGALAELSRQPFELLQALEQRLAANASSDRSPAVASGSALALTVADARLLVPRAEVREVVDLPLFTRIPGAKPWLLGIANMGGSLLPITDLAGLLGLGGVREDGGSRMIVLNHSQTPAAFRVSGIVGFRPLPTEQQRQCHTAAPENPIVSRCLLDAFEQDGVDWQLISLRTLVTDPVFLDAGR